MSENTVPRTGRLSAAKATDCATPRLFIVHRPPAQQPDGEAILRDVERYLLTRLRAAKKLAAPAYVRWYAIGCHSLLVARSMSFTPLPDGLMPLHLNR